MCLLQHTITGWSKLFAVPSWPRQATCLAGLRSCFLCSAMQPAAATSRAPGCLAPTCVSAAPQDGSIAPVACTRNTNTTTSLSPPAQPGLGTVHQQAAGLCPCVPLPARSLSLTHTLPRALQNLGVDWEERVLPSIGNEVVKAVVAQYNAEQLLTQRDKVSKEVGGRIWGWGD